MKNRVIWSDHLFRCSIWHNEFVSNFYSAHTHSSFDWPKSKCGYICEHFAGKKIHCELRARAPSTSIAHYFDRFTFQLIFVKQTQARTQTHTKLELLGIFIFFLLLKMFHSIYFRVIYAVVIALNARTHTLSNWFVFFLFGRIAFSLASSFLNRCPISEFWNDRGGRSERTKRWQKCERNVKVYAANMQKMGGSIGMMLIDVTA